MDRLAPAMKSLVPLAGRWSVALTWSPAAHALVGGPATVTMQARFAFVEEGKFLLYTIGPSRWLIGYDDDAGEYSVLYGDARNVARVYRMTFRKGVWRIWRSAPQFHQRFEGRLVDGGRRINAAWEKSEDGRRWQLDFEMVYRRVDGRSARAGRGKAARGRRPQAR